MADAEAETRMLLLDVDDDVVNMVLVDTDDIPVIDIEEQTKVDEIDVDGINVRYPRRIIRWCAREIGPTVGK